MDTEIIILNLNELERKFEKMQEDINNYEVQYDSDDTENLIAEEVHWCLKLLRKLFCYK